MNPLVPTITTPSGVWNPLVWLMVFLLSLIIALIIYMRGEKTRKKGMQAGVFFSGDRPPEGMDAHIAAHNIGWGFMEALRPYYRAMRKMHTGIINDYVGWFLGILAVMLIIFLFWGGA
ncbi:MAG: hydrogenase [Euryarchaeota archaeon]|nr:hydrogenase [Euryarchaeota archaeon]